MEAFATSSDYMAYYDVDIEPSRLDALLMKASRLIAAQLTASGIEWAKRAKDDCCYAGLLADVACDVVHRSIGEGGKADIPYGASQFGETTGSVSWQFSMSNPYGDMFLSAANKAVLGIGRSRGRMLHPAIEQGVEP